MGYGYNNDSDTRRSPSNGGVMTDVNDAFAKTMREAAEAENAALKDRISLVWNWALLRLPY